MCKLFLTGYKHFTDWLNKAWQMGNYTCRKTQKADNYYTTGKYMAEPVTRYAGYKI